MDPSDGLYGLPFPGIEFMPNTIDPQLVSQNQLSSIVAPSTTSEWHGDMATPDAFSTGQQDQLFAELLGQASTALRYPSSGDVILSSEVEEDPASVDYGLSLQAQEDLHAKEVIFHLNQSSENIDPLLKAEQDQASAGQPAHQAVTATPTTVAESNGDVVTLGPDLISYLQSQGITEELYHQMAAANGTYDMSKWGCPNLDSLKQLIDYTYGPTEAPSTPSHQPFSLSYAVEYWNNQTSTMTQVTVPPSILPTPSDSQHLGLRGIYVQCPLAAEAIIDLVQSEKIQRVTQRMQETDVVSGSVFVFKVGDGITRWTDSKTWTVSRKGNGHGDMVYRETNGSKGANTKETNKYKEASHIPVTDENVGSTLYMTPQEVAHCGIPAAEIAQYLVFSLTSGNDLKNHGLVKRTTKVIRDGFGNRVPRDSPYMTQKKALPSDFSVYGVVSIYRIGDVCNGTVKPFMP